MPGKEARGGIFRVVGEQRNLKRFATKDEQHRRVEHHKIKEGKGLRCGAPRTKDPILGKKRNRHRAGKKENTDRVVRRWPKRKPDVFGNVVREGGGRDGIPSYRLGQNTEGSGGKCHVGEGTCYMKGRKIEEQKIRKKTFPPSSLGVIPTTKKK